MSHTLKIGDRVRLIGSFDQITLHEIDAYNLGTVIDLLPYREGNQIYDVGVRWDLSRGAWMHTCNGKIQSPDPHNGYFVPHGYLKLVESFHLIEEQSTPATPVVFETCFYCGNTLAIISGACLGCVKIIIENARKQHAS